MAGDNQDRALRVTNDVFGDTADERVLQPCATVSGSDDEINIGLARCGADFVDRRDQGEFRFERSDRAKNPSA